MRKNGSGLPAYVVLYTSMQELAWPDYLDEETGIFRYYGDNMLYRGNQIVIFYDSNSWSYTPIGHIDASAEELEAFLSGDEDEVTIRLVD